MIHQENHISGKFERYSYESIVTAVWLRGITYDINVTESEYSLKGMVTELWSDCDYLQQSYDNGEVFTNLASQLPHGCDVFWQFFLIFVVFPIAVS